jgi:hypothetical protein
VLIILQAGIINLKIPIRHWEYGRERIQIQFLPVPASRGTLWGCGWV